MIRLLCEQSFPASQHIVVVVRLHFISKSGTAVPSDRPALL